MTLESSSQVSAFTEVIFIAKVLGEDENPYIGDLEIELITENYIGQIQALTYNGAAKFTGYFNKNFTATVKTSIKGTSFSYEVVVYVMNPNFTIEFERISPTVFFI